MRFIKNKWFVLAVAICFMIAGILGVVFINKGRTQAPIEVVTNSSEDIKQDNTLVVSKETEEERTESETEESETSESESIESETPVSESESFESESESESESETEKPSKKKEPKEPKESEEPEETEEQEETKKPDNPPKIEPQWLYYKSASSGISAEQTAKLDSFVKSWTKGKLSTSQMIDMTSQYMLEEGFEFSSVPVVPSHRRLIASLDEIPDYDMVISLGDYWYDFIGLYTEGEYDEFGNLICYEWEAGVFK